MKKNGIILITILITILLLLLLICVYFGYTKYQDYNLNENLKEILLIQDSKKEEEIIKDYQDLLAKYKDDGKIYMAVSNYYMSKSDLNKSINILYKGIDNSRDKKVLSEKLNAGLKDMVFTDAYIRVDMGKEFKFKDIITIKTQKGDSLELRVNISNHNVNTSKEGVIEVRGEEKYTGKPIKIDVEVLEETGNTMANNINGGKMAYKDDWIYFNNPEDKGLYKMKKDLSQKTKLDGDVEPLFINIKGNNLYYIDVKSGQYGSLIKTDLEGKHKEVVRQNTAYVYIIGDYIYYEETKGVHSGWTIVSMNKMNFKHEDIKKELASALGGIQMLNSKRVYTTNKYGGFVSKEDRKDDGFTWGDASKYKYLSSPEVYKGEIYGTMLLSELASDKNIFGKIDVENNTQTIIIEDVEKSNSIGNYVYFLSKNEVFTSNMNGENKTKVMDYFGDANQTSLYALGNAMYIYSNEIKIVEKPVSDNATANNINTPNIKNDEIVKLCNDANKLILLLVGAKNSDEYIYGDVTYLALKSPYNNKLYVKSQLSKYFSKSYVEKFMSSALIIEKDGNLYFQIGDIGMGGSCVYSSIVSRTNKGTQIQAVAYYAYQHDISDGRNENIILKVEDGKWKIDKFRSVI